MKNLFLFAMFNVLCLNTFSQVQSRTNLTINQFKSFYNKNTPDSLFNILSESTQKVLTKENTAKLFTQLKSEMGNLEEVSFISSQDDIDIYRGRFQKAVVNINLSTGKDFKIIKLYFSPFTVPFSPDSSVIEQPIIVKGPTETISGIISLPKFTKRKIPVILIIPGSGATNMDGNTPNSNMFPNTYRLLSESLAKAGFASLRYDKRGIGNSSGFTNESDIRVENYLGDIQILLDTLNRDKRFSKVILLGHSEGALFATIAAEKGKASALISVAGAGESIDNILIKQTQSSPSDLHNEIKNILNSLKTGKSVKTVNPALYELFRPSVQPYLISWIKYDPSIEIKKVSVPILIIQGTTDIQVSVDNALKLKQANPNAIIEIIEGMNHALKTSSKDPAASLASYSNPNLPLSERLPVAINTFISGLE